MRPKECDALCGFIRDCTPNLTQDRPRGNEWDPHRNRSSTRGWKEAPHRSGRRKARGGLTTSGCAETYLIEATQRKCRINPYSNQHRQLALVTQEGRHRGQSKHHPLRTHPKIGVACRWRVKGASHTQRPSIPFKAVASQGMRPGTGHLDRLAQPTQTTRRSSRKRPSGSNPFYSDPPQSTGEAPRRPYG